MAQVKFKVVERKTQIPNKSGKKVVYSANMVKHGKTTTRQLAGQISEKTSFTRADVLGLLEAISSEILKEMLLGKSVHLEGLGTFSLDIRSSSTETLEEFTHRNIEGLKIRFTPSTEMKAKLIDVSYREEE